MSQTVRAVYREGHLDLLEPVDLFEGQQVALTILSERDQARAVLGDLVVDVPPPPDDSDDADEEALMREIEEGTRGVTVSDAIIEERREGP